MGKLFRILRLDERKGRWVVEQVEQDLQGNFQVNVTCFFPFSLVTNRYFQLCSPSKLVTLTTAKHLLLLH